MSTATRTTAASIFVTVGTDHHPFDRLIGWIDSWIAERSATGDIACFVQTGPSARPERADSRDYLSYDEMIEQLRSAAAVVTHGGPATIMMCAHAGKRPIVVPRRQALGEHVDDHQLVFSRRIATEGTIELAESDERLFELLDRVVEGRGMETTARPRDVVAAVNRFETLIGHLVGGGGAPAASAISRSA
jgi:UDP-N-acetylglucosamine transferase subunit ALG13